MKIKRYTSADKEAWDNFVDSSKNGTFLLSRNFVEYHRHRFEDHSLLFYEEDALIGLIAGNVNEGVYYSHQGLTYGGLIMSAATTAMQVLSIFDKLTAYLRTKGYNSFVYKAIPHIYHSIPAEEDLYALFRLNAKLTQRNISSTIVLPNNIEYSRSRLRGLKKAEKSNLTVSKSTDFSAFWTILADNLEARHDTNPVHTLEEIIYLKDKFEKEIQLYVATDSKNVIQGGCLTFEMDTIIHAQYTSATNEGRENGAIDAIITHIIESASANVRYFDYGISTEQGGKLLNEGLIYQKEGFGARGIVYDVYAIEL